MKLAKEIKYDQHFTQNSKEGEPALDKENIDFLFQTSYSKTHELVSLLSYNITVGLKAFMDFFSYNNNHIFRAQSAIAPHLWE